MDGRKIEKVRGRKNCTRHLRKTGGHGGQITEKSKENRERGWVNVCVGGGVRKFGTIQNPSYSVS